MTLLAANDIGFLQLRQSLFREVSQALVDPQENPLLAPVGPAQEAVDHRVNRRAAVENRLDSFADRHLDAEPLSQS